MKYIRRLSMIIVLLLSAYWAYEVLQIMFDPVPGHRKPTLDHMGWITGFCLVAYIALNIHMLKGRWLVKILFILPIILPFIIPAGFFLNNVVQESLRSQAKLIMPDGYEGYAMIYFDTIEDGEESDCNLSSELSMDRGYIIIEGCHFDMAQDFVVNYKKKFVTKSGKEKQRFGWSSMGNVLVTFYLSDSWESYNKTMESSNYHSIASFKNFTKALEVFNSSEGNFHEFFQDYLANDNEFSPSDY